MEVPANLVRRFAIQEVRDSRFWYLDRIIRWTLRSHIRYVRLMKWLCASILTVENCRYFLQQNTAIERGEVTGLCINLKVLGIGDGITVRRLVCPTG